MSVTLVTDAGNIKIELYCADVPVSSENFLALAAKGYYDNTLIHRNVKGFMVQMGDPTGTGKGGKSIWGRKYEDEIVDHLRHSSRGVVCMANSGPDTNGSQFFITYKKQPHLDMKTTIVGKVIDGWDTLDTLESTPVTDRYRPIREMRLKHVIMHANPLADQAV